MGNCNTIIFKEDINNPGMARVIEESRKWYDINKDTISNIHSIFSVERDENSPTKYRNILIIHYTGDAGINPTKCNHSEYFDKIIIPGSCDKDNIHGRFCSFCRMLLTTYTSKPGIKHTGSFISNNDATCLEDGTRSGICNVCGEYVTEDDPGSALGHDYVWETYIPESCLTDREEVGICSRCGDKIYRTVENSRLGHNHIWSVNFAETCETDRIEIGVCSRCQDTIRKTIIDSALGHDYVYTSNNDATCLEDGTKTGICNRCGKEITNIDNGSLLGHTYPDEWIIRTLPTINSTGLKFKKCIRCDSEITEVIPKLKHNWVSNNNGTHTCVTEGCCGVTENCSPSGYGETCTKCGYVNPDIPLKIITTYINGMILDTNFYQKLESTIPNGVIWMIESGALPNGITLSDDGILQGIPTTSGLYTFKIKCIYEDQTSIKEYSINIANILVTITFNATGGIASETSRSIAKGSTIGTLPTVSRDGYEFGGWFTAETGGLKVDESYSVASDIILYARWGQGTDLEFGDATSTFNIQYNNDRTNYNNQPYTFYNRYHDGSISDLTIQTCISSLGNSNNMTSENNIVKLYMKVTNNGEAGTFDIGFDCDSYVEGDDCLYITRIENGVNLNDHFEVTVPYETSIWAGKYNNRVSNRYKNIEVGTRVGKPGDRAGSSNDTGYAFTMNNIFINSKSYTILEVTFTKIN